jgi:mannose-1-phosphate guanylyltransferase/phosphomannomutase
MAGKVSVNVVEPSLAEHPSIHLSPDAKVDDQANLHGMVVLGDNSRVAGRSSLTNCVVGRNCQIEEGVELEDAVLWDNVFIKSNTRIVGSTIGHQVRIGQGVSIEPGVVVADETTVGDQVQIRPDVKIWPRKVIEDGAIVTTNLIWGEKWRKSLFEGAVVRGLTNVEMTPEFSARLGAAYGSTLPKGSFVLTGRDAILSSRMLKRSFVGGLLSAGVNVRDVKMISLPVLRNKLTTFGEAGGIHFRQSPEDPAATEIVFFDEQGNEISSSAAKGIERIYFKENFRRAHHSEPGWLEELPRIYDFYREGFLRELDHEVLKKAAPKVVIDLNHSPAADLLPDLLAELGIEVIELNSHVHEKFTDPTPEQLEQALSQLSRIVVTLEADAGFWLGPSGEKVQLIDAKGHVYTNREALCTLTALACQAEETGQLVVPVAAPGAIDLLAEASGLSVRRTRSDGHSLVDTAKERQTRMVASMDGRFGFTGFQPNFDGLFTVAKTIELIAQTGLSLHEAWQQVPKHAFHHLQLPCSWEYKGGLMRRLSEDAVDQQASFTDGVRVDTDRGWALVLPDPHRPVAHIYVESSDPAEADQLLETYRDKVGGWLQEMAQQ